MAIIDDFHEHLVRAVVDGDLRGRAAMLEGVGERFLDDAVRRQVDRDGGFGGFTCFRDGHLQAGLVDLGHENGQVGQTRSRGQDAWGSPSCRSTPRRRRISVNAARLVVSIEASARRASSGCVSMT